MFKNMSKTPVAPSIKSIIDEYIVLKGKEYVHHSEPFFFHPSSVGYTRCLRQLQFQFVKAGLKEEYFTDVDNKIKYRDYSDIEEAAKRQRIFRNGDFMHDRYQKLMDEIGIIKDIELVFRYELKRVKGSIDAVVSIDNEDYIIELKSMNTIQFNNLKEPTKAHLKQITLYMHTTGIHKGFILVENKNDQNIKEFYVEYDLANISDILGKIDTVIEQSKQNKLCDKKRSSCNSCEFQSLCEMDLPLFDYLKAPFEEFNWEEYKWNK